MLAIGPYRHSSRVIIAPMAGVTDRPFRNLCRHFGAYWTVSEMITSDTRLWHTDKSQNRMRFHDEPEPRWVQIAGAEPLMMAEAARLNVERGAQIIDINMGCPARKVCNKAAGSALLRDENLVAKILTAVVDSVDIPVTLKIRLGWSPDEKNARAIAQIAEASGIQLLTVHGRTRACKFKGPVDYETIGEVASAVSIPIVANGDIDSPEKARQVMRLTDAHAVMVGRVAQGSPWVADIFDHYLKTGERKDNPTQAEIKCTLVRHLGELHQFYGGVMGVRIARKHVAWYLQSIVDGNEFRQRFNRLQTTGEQLEAIEKAPLILRKSVVQENLAA